jgi:hypothetical protein
MRVARTRVIGAGGAPIEAVDTPAASAAAGQARWVTPHFNETARNICDRIGKAAPHGKYNRR